MTVVSCTVHTSNTTFLCKHGSLDFLHLGYGPFYFESKNKICCVNQSTGKSLHTISVSNMTFYFFTTIDYKRMLKAFFVVLWSGILCYSLLNSADEFWACYRLPHIHFIPFNIFLLCSSLPQHTQYFEHNPISKSAVELTQLIFRPFSWSASSYPPFYVHIIQTCCNSDTKMRWSTILHEPHALFCCDGMSCNRCAILLCKSYHIPLYSWRINN